MREGNEFLRQQIVIVNKYHTHNLNVLTNVQCTYLLIYNGIQVFTIFWTILKIMAQGVIERQFFNDFRMFFFSLSNSPDFSALWFEIPKINLGWEPFG